MKIVLWYLAVINIFTFILYGVDKKKARNNQWRISEKTLFLFPILGGSIGGIVGMYFFHHKTKHWYFEYGLPLILIVQVILTYLFWKLKN